MNFRWFTVPVATATRQACEQGCYANQEVRTARHNAPIRPLAKWVAIPVG